MGMSLLPSSAAGPVQASLFLITMRYGREPEFSDAFYTSWQWRRCRDGYLKHVGGLCERCLANGLIVPAEQVHHKTKLTPENITDPQIALAWGNLEALCAACHQAEHRCKRWRCDASGHVALP